MAHRLKVSTNYATHLPALMRAMAWTTGDVLEMGMGVFSTPYLHYACQMQGRRLVSYETDAGWAALFLDNEASYRGGRHVIKVVESWDHANLDSGWDVALIDHSPSARRVVDITRLAHRARYIIIHDSEPKWDSVYNYPSIYPLFKWRTDWTQDYRWATVLSNFVDLGDFWN